MNSYINNREIIFHGWQNHEVLYKNIYPRLDIFVHFAHTEGVTIAPREAMAHGAVPVVSEFVGLKAEGQFLNEINSLTFPVGDIEAATRNVFRLISEEGLLERLSDAAMRSQTGKYSYSGAIEAWAQAFKRCMEKPSSNKKNLKITFPPDGRLAQIGVHPWLGQRIRDLFRRKHVHTDGGSEWPTGSGLMPVEKEKEIMKLTEVLDKPIND